MNGIDIVTQLMEQQGVSQAELARRLGYAYASGVSERLRGSVDMRADTLAKFLEALGCELVVRSKSGGGKEWIVGTSPNP